MGTLKIGNNSPTYSYNKLQKLEIT